MKQNVLNELFDEKTHLYGIKNDGTDSRNGAKFFNIFQTNHLKHLQNLSKFKFVWFNPGLNDFEH